MIHPREQIDQAPMSRVQIVAVTLTVMLLALDGFDVLSISFASPGIAAQWHIDRAALGVVLSMELFGMAAGALVIGALADRIGRRPAILGCLVVMAVGMALCSRAPDVGQLSLFRLVTGFGIGGMLTSANSMSAEFSNLRRRHLCVSLTTIGYPLGAIAGGMIAAYLLARFSWRSIFVLGCGWTLALFPLVLLGMPESPSFLIDRRSRGGPIRLNRLLERMGLPAVQSWPIAAEGAAKASIRDMLAGPLALPALALALAFFLHMATFYFILKWVPKIVVDMGFPPSSAAGVLVWANVGGATGGALFGLATARWRLLPLTLAALLLACVAVSVFGWTPADLATMSILACGAGLCTNGAMVGLYATAAERFPTTLRATGTGFAIGIGRGGAAFSPILAGYLFKSGMPLAEVAAILGCGSLLAAGCLIVGRSAAD